MQNSIRKTGKVLITGGLGFIFSYVTEYLVAKGYDVVVIDNLSEGSHPEVIKEGGFTFYQYDVADSLTKIVVATENPDYIIHAAAITSVDESIASPPEVVKNNLEATLNMFDVARTLTHLKKLLYVSTDEVYGECYDRKKEGDIIFPRNPYSCSKAMGSLLRYAYDNTYPELKDKTAEIRMCNIFGPRQDERKIMPAIIRAIKTGRPVSLQERGEGYREYLYVKNVPPIVEQILLKGNRVYNITNNDGYRVNELIEIFEALTGKEVPTVPSNRPGHDKIYQMDNARLKKEFNWKPQYSFKEGLMDYLKYEKII